MKGPWQKYANRPRLGRPSEFPHDLPLRGSIERTIAKLFGRYTPLGNLLANSRKP